MNGTTRTGQWLSIRQPNPRAALRLFCFPYAGGGASVYSAWPRNLPSAFEVCAVQLPGRETRLKEQPFRELTPVVEAVAAAIEPYLDRPFAFFGHSMGALISFELARLLRERGGARPAHLFVSGRRAPQLPDDEPPTYDLPDEEFFAILRELNGTPTEVLEHPELMELVMPLLRADFALVQTYVYKPEAPLDCPITAFGGVQDVEVVREDIKAWREQTADAFSARLLPGDHFFLNHPQTRAVMLSVIEQELYHSIGSVT
jgi:medium-chain acyl-[acyl-carrier-protein] hydrolase